MSAQTFARDERRYCELRADGGGRTLTGVAVRYGDVANLPWGDERFEAGAFGDVAGADVICNVQHAREKPIARTGGGGLTLRDDGAALTIEATLPETRDADDALALVRAGVLRGLSIEFRVSGERWENNVRVVTGAALSAVAVVDRPAYPAATVAARSAALPARFHL